MTVWKHDDNFTFRFVLDEESELCLFVRTDEHALTILVIISVLTVVETAIIPDRNPVSVFFTMLEFSEVDYFCIRQVPLNYYVLRPFTNQLLLAIRKHAKS